MSAALKIEKGVPIPDKRSLPRKRRTRRGLLGAIFKMEIGDSILTVDKKQTVVSASGRNVTKETGAKFTTRRVEGGVRIWRVS